MKNIATILLFMFITFSYSQFTVNPIIIDMAGTPVVNETKNGTYYIKDINNYMLPYIGTWKYTYGNKEFRITITKVEMHHVYIPDRNIDYYTDGLRIKYQKYENGILIYDSPLRMNPTGVIKEFGKLGMSFTDYQRNDESFPLKLTLIPFGNQYQLKFWLNKFERRNTYYQQHPNEPYFSVPNDIIMTKM
jgi:hypothetical protein